MTTPDGSSGITSALAAISDEAALGNLNRYFGNAEWAGKEFTGAHFESLGTPDPERMTAEDIVAVACLSIHVPARTAVGVLGKQRDKISDHLDGIPNGVALEDIPFEEHDRYFGCDSSAHLLWWLLRRHHGVGATTASKIMARKRPALIPIYDSVVGKATGFPNADGTWRAWHHAFATDRAFTSRLRSLREAAGLDRVSLLRILDVTLWMHGRHGANEPERVGDTEED
jgi:hypothetical protein